MSRNRLGRAAPLILALATGCIPTDPGPFRPLAIGAEAGRPVVVYTGCSTAGVTGVRIYDIGDDRTFDSGSDRLLWRVRLPAPSAERTFAVASPPAGATPDPAWPAGLPDDQMLVAEVELADGATYFLDFTLKELSPDSYVLPGNARLPRSELAGRPCEQPPPD